MPPGTELRGVFAIMATPFLDDGRLDEDGLRRLVEWLVSRGVHGLTILGIGGEVYKLMDVEREQVIELVTRQAAGRLPVVVGAGHPGGTRATIDYCRRAEAAGAVAVMVAPPFIARPSSDQIVEFYVEVAAALSIPIVIQDEPVTTGIQLPATLLARIAQVVPSCRYAKVEHVPTPPKFSAITALVPDQQLGLLGGTGGLYFIEELERGARGTMTGFAFPEVLVAIWEQFAAGDRTAARDLFHRWLPLIMFEAQPEIGLAIRKEILRRRGALRSSALRRPAPGLDAPTLYELEVLLRQFGEPDGSAR